MNGDVQITDTAGTGLFNSQDTTVFGNSITFGNDTMTGSTETGAMNIFNLNLMVTSSGDIVSEGKTTINNFGELGPANANVLDLQLSQALYDAILTANGITSSSTPTPITGAMLDTYLTSHHGSITEKDGSATINFSNGHGNSDDLGSITLTGVTLPNHQIADMGSNLSITADGITTIDPLSDSSNVYHLDMPGNTVASYTQNTHIVDTSSLGHIVDFNGALNLKMSSALYQALGLSESHTAAQNLQALENGANTSTGGMAVSSTTTGAGADAVTNTTLTFEAMVNGHLSTYGSITLYNTHFTATDPLSAHLQITPH